MPQVVDICMLFLDTILVKNDTLIISPPSDNFTTKIPSSMLNKTTVESGRAGEHLNDFIDNFCKELLTKVILQQDDMEHNNLIKYIYPAILVFGIFANLFSLILMTRISNKRKNFQKFTFSLAILALADLGVLIFGCSREYIDAVLDLSLRKSNIYSCKLIYFLCYLFSSFSAYLHAYIACERWNAIYNPIKNFKWTLQKSRTIIAVIFIVCVVFNMPLFWFANLRETINISNMNSIGVTIIIECVVESSILMNAFPIFIDTVFYCLIPFIVTTLFSSMTLYTLLNAKKKRAFCDSESQSYGTSIVRRYKKCDDSVSLSRLNVKESKAPRKSGFVRKSNITEEKSLENIILTTEMVDDQYRRSTTLSARSVGSIVSFTCQKNKLTEKKFKSTLKSQSTKMSNLRTTIMLTSIPINYLVTSFPIFVILICGWVLRVLEKDNGDTSYNLNQAYSIGIILMYIGSSINIFFYIFLGKNFRRTIVLLIGTLRKKIHVNAFV